MTNQAVPTKVWNKLVIKRNKEPHLSNWGSPAKSSNESQPEGIEFKVIWFSLWKLFELLALGYKFKASLVYTVRPCFKN